METINRTFKTLELFLEHEGMLGITELSKLSGMSPAVTHRIASALMNKGYLIQKEKKGKYSLGVKFLEFGYVIQSNLKLSDIAYPFLLNLSKEADEAATLGILDGNTLLVVERIETSHQLRVSGAVGKRAPLHATAIGKILLAEMSEAERKSIFDDPSLEKSTQNTITDICEMEKELELFRAEGVVFEREEVAVGVWSIAAPIYGVTGKIEAGVAIVAPISRITKEKASRFVMLTKSCASQISRELGYRG